MNIAICSIHKLAGTIEQYRPDALVTALSPWMILGRTNVPTLSLVFSDIEQAHGDRCTGATPSHITKLQALVAEQPERLLIICKRGLSRSPALAIVTAIADGYDPSDACAAVHDAVPHASPNRWVLRLAHGPELVERAIATFTYARSPYGPIGEPSGFAALRPRHSAITSPWLTEGVHEPPVRPRVLLGRAGRLG